MKKKITILELEKLNKPKPIYELHYWRINSDKFKYHKYFEHCSDALRFIRNNDHKYHFEIYLNQ